MGKTNGSAQRAADAETEAEQKTRDEELTDEEAADPADPELTESDGSAEHADVEQSKGKEESGGDGARDGDGVEQGKTSERQDAASKIQEALAVERDKYLRLAAEYDNFRKRSAKERENTYNDARADAITRLLPVYDNLERALKVECADEAFYKGVEMTMTQLMKILEGMDVRCISSVGDLFDPNLHNAVMTVENPELGEKIIAEEFQKGFTLGQRVIRHSTVVVAN
ncbi:MAG: nucleotide exchange factor GrpE [Oscillospiraceae bacterium]|nr:nucleotide exchange factor GrpE [Oscillospiraceae bacterium]